MRAATGQILGAPRLPRRVLQSATHLGLVTLGVILFALLFINAAPAPSPLVVLVFALAGLAVIAVVAAPRIALAVAMFLLPVVSIKFLRGDLIMPIVMIGTIAAGHARWPRIPYPIAIGLVTFLAMNAISAVNATNSRRAASFMAVTLFLYVTAVWFAGIFRRRPFVRTAIRAYVWSSLASGAIGIFALHLHPPLSNMLLFGNNRARAFFKDPNDFGSYLVPAAAILLEEMARPRLLGWPPKRLAVGLGVLLVGIVESFSRDAIINVVVAFTIVLAVYGARRGGLRATVRILAVISACTVVGFSFLAATGSLHYLSERSQGQSYDTQRFSNQANALNEGTHGLLGHGPGQSEVLLPLPTHSLYVRALFEQGAFGLIATILIVGGTLVVAGVLTLRDADLHGLGSAALFGSWFGLAIASIFVDTVHWRLPYLLMGLIWAAAAPPLTAPGRARLTKPAAPIAPPPRVQ